MRFLHVTTRRRMMVLPVVVAVLWGGIAGRKWVNGHESGQSPTDRTTRDTAIFAEEGAKARRTRDPHASVAVGDLEVLATTTGDAREVRLSVSGGDGNATMTLPESAGRITELRMCPWMNVGVAVAVEATNEVTKDVSYHWATAWVDRKARRVGDPTGAEFLRSKINYDMGSLINPGSDSIYTVLSRYQRNNPGQGVDGYVFIHGCPVGPSRGSVIPFEASQRR